MCRQQRLSSTISSGVFRLRLSMLLVSSCISLIYRPLSNAFAPTRLRLTSSCPMPSVSYTEHIFASTNTNIKTFVASPSANIVYSMDSEGQERTVAAKIVSSTSLSECGARLREGNLVAFPTETVYGLGCDALNPSAIRKVFKAKERPLTDPLIVHVHEHQEAFDLWKAEDSTIEGQTLIALSRDFWPGPLTLVANANSHVPKILMANTGFVACRSPSHPLARALIQTSQVPLAAPSANKFGHVSPTRAHHVWDDLLHEDVWIIDASDNTSNGNEEAVCKVGVESTVAKVEMIGDTEKGKVTLLRQGAISVDDIKDCLDKAGLGEKISVEAHTKQVMEDHVATVAPGQTIRHYSPRIPSFILSQSRYTAAPVTTQAEETYLARAVVIDFGRKMAAFKSHALAYRDLSESGDSSEAARLVFDTLRWAEQVEGGERILFPQSIEESSEVCGDALSLALKDRLTRAASGKVIETLR